MRMFERRAGEVTGVAGEFPGKGLSEPGHNLGLQATRHPVTTLRFL